MAWLPTGAVARVLGCSVKTVRYFAGKGRLAVVRTPTGARLFDPDDVARFAREQRAWRKPHACLFCGTAIAQERKFCAGETCRKARQRVRWRRAQAKRAATDLN